MLHLDQMRFAWALLLVPQLALADPDPERVVVVGRVETGAWTDAPTTARLDQKAELAAVVVARRGKKRVVLAPATITKVRIAGRTWKTEPLVDAKVQWSTVEPHGFRLRPASNGVSTEFYSNVSQDPGTFGKWLGYDHIDYFERIVMPWSTVATIPAAVTAGETGTQQVPGLGTIRYKVEVELAGRKLASAGAESRDLFGLLPAVHRVSIRKSDDFIGHLSAYLLVPEVFGSAGPGRNHQTERFTGADCADVMIGAARRMGRSYAYTNVAGLPTLGKQIATAVDLDDRGMPAREITKVRAGDLIRIDYGGPLRGHTPRGWDHVAALWEDKSDPNGPFKGAADGRLDGFDLVIHMGHPRLVIEPLAQQAPATIDVVRLR